MRISDLVPRVGRCYRLRDDPTLGDYSGLEVKVEAGPRSPNDPHEQYRVSWGSNSMDVDWIHTTMFKGAVEVPERRA